MRRFLPLVLAMSVAIAAAAPSTAWPATKNHQRSQSYVVLYKTGVSAADARAAVRAAGGQIVRENLKVSVATARSSNPRFLAAASRKAALDGVARDRRIGHVPQAWRQAKRGRVDKFAFEKGDFRGEDAGTAVAPGPPPIGAEPLAGLQWDMRMIRATAEGSHAVQPGDRGVRVGILDTGIDASHPDMAANFDPRLSRNFTTDIPVDPLGNEIDGPCAEEPDGSCSDPENVDENGHGTHVSGSVAAAANGRGIAGVAPNVTLVNLRAGQDSGFFFLQPSVDALTYAGDHGIDVVNMSYFIDPWLFNCESHPADSPAEQLEQQTVIRATQRALSYAHRRGVTLIASAGNEAADYSKPVVDEISPDFPLGTEKERVAPPDCLVLPTEGRNVLSIVALGPSERKSFYSSYGVGHAFVAAPGGDSMDTATGLANPQNRILSTYPEFVARTGDIEGDGIPDIDPVTGNPISNRIICERDSDGSCDYYAYLQGTSQASPHAVGVAAVIISEFGKRDKRKGGLELQPRKTERILRQTAREHACPTPNPTEFGALCEGGPRYNGFYGFGIVDALSAATAREDDDDDD
jgi:lantibiotic leader peptide-processing serine protease